MKDIKLLKVLASTLVATVFMSLFAAGAFGAAAVDIDAVIADTAAYIQENVTAPGIGQIGGDWAIVALMRSGTAVTDDYIRNYYDKVTDELVAARGKLSAVKYSEYSRVALAMISIGADPRDVGGYDLLAPLTDFDATVFQGINGPIFALDAFDASGYDYIQISERYIEYILSKQLEDGGFTLSGNNSDPDTTGMALAVLSGYKERADVADAINRALDRISKLQRPTGGFTSFSSTNSESVAQVIIALCSLDISIDDERFVKDGNTLLDNLLTYYTPGQGFEHEKGGGASLMATEQVLCALASLRRMKTGENTLFDMSDAPIFQRDPKGGGLEGKHPDIIVPGLMLKTPEFNDIGGHEHEDAIIALFEREVVFGYSADSFAPDKTVTRAEFAAMIVRALGLRDDEICVAYIDVPVGAWFYNYVGTAGGYGIVYGRSAEEFDPYGLISRQEAALMVSRAASLCGLEAVLDNTAIRNILAPFNDYRSAASWASEALAFCCYFGFLDDWTVELKPTEQMQRGESAEMIYRMLQKAKLI